MEEGGSMSVWGPVFEALAVKGWCFRDIHQLQSSMQQTVIAPNGNRGEMGSSNLIESELLNMDLRDIGGRYLPDPSSLKKSSYFHGPKVLQVVSVRDISRSSIDASMKNFQHRLRLLRFCLTDGYSQVTAIEYVPIPSITDEIVPGTKVRLENKIPINSGILCLDPKSIKILGGRVATLYEEWEMNQKYAGFSRSSLKLPQSSESLGPPPFQKMQIGSHMEKHRFPNTSETTSKPALSMFVESSGAKIDVKSNISSSSARVEDKPSSSYSRPKEAHKAIPVQNQEAAQKLLQKMSQPNREERHVRGPKHRGKSKEDEPVVFTLEEWEKRKGGAKPLVTDAYQDVSRDEELAWQLQKQLDMEDYHVKSGPESEAERIRKSMFNFGRAEDSRSDGREVRGRGRGRGRGRHKRRYD